MGERIVRVDLESYISVGGRRESNLWVKPKIGERIQINKKSEPFGPEKDLAIKKARRLKVPLLIVDKDALEEAVNIHHYHYAIPVIKTFNPEGGHFYNGGFASGSPVNTLIEAIKLGKRLGEKSLSYIGEQGRLDVDTSKIKCKECRRRTERLEMN